MNRRWNTWNEKCEILQTFWLLLMIIHVGRLVSDVTQFKIDSTCDICSDCECQDQIHSTLEGFLLRIWLAYLHLVLCLSSNSSCHAARTDFPNPHTNTHAFSLPLFLCLSVCLSLSLSLSPSVSILHCFWKVFLATSCVRKELL